MQKQLLFIFILLSCGLNKLKAGGNPPASLSGTYQVGTSQPVYKKLADVAAALNNTGNTVTGNIIFELNSDYTGTSGETFPIVFKQFNSTGNWTVTIRPKAGVSMRMTAGNPGDGQPLIILDGADNLRFDGRAGGSAGIAWLIRNTRTTGTVAATVQLKNDAQYNVLTYLQLEGQVSNSASGIVHLARSTEPEGNDDNTISYCNIRDRSDITGAKPAVGIYSQGTFSSGTGHFNSGNIITHNNIFNFFDGGSFSFGLSLAAGTTATEVTYNSFYQTSTLTSSSTELTTMRVIDVNETAVDNTIIQNNFIGGSAPECGGTPFSLTAPFINFYGISFSSSGGGNGTENLVSNNILRNLVIVMDDSPTGQVFNGISIGHGHVDVTNNTIGNSGAQDAIKITASDIPDRFVCYMISFSSPAGGKITGNTVGGITISGTQASASASTLICINVGFLPTAVSPATILISDNLVGNTAMTDNIRGLSAGLPLSFTGISGFCTTPLTTSYKQNIVAGVELKYAGTANDVYVRGISCSGWGTHIVDSNIISDISSAHLAPRGSVPSLAGIFGDLNRASHTISNNIIRRLRLTGTTAPPGAPVLNSAISGIAVPSGTAQIYNNRLYGFASANILTDSSVTVLSGMDIHCTATIYNNLVDLTNNASTNNCEIRGIRVLNWSPLTSSVTVNAFHNSIYIGGSNGGASNTAVSALIDANGTGPFVTTYYLRNNLLVNGRSGGSGAHYLFRNTAANPAGNWTATASDNNVLITRDLTKIAAWGSSVLDSAQWKTTGGDAGSSFYTYSQVPPAVLFTDLITGDLSIRENARQYVAGKGAGGTGITTDYTGQSRNTVAPSAGAYEYPTSVTPVNTAPVITSYNGDAAVMLQVAENTMTVATVTAMDADAGTTLVYSLGGGEDAGKFTVNSAAGVLSFITAPDFEQPGDANGDNAYVVSVQVSDGDTAVIQRFKIKITDANDHAPVITSYNGSAAVTLQVAENQTAVGTVTATDADKNVTITYSLVNEEDAAKFTVNSSTGILSFIAAPDFEQPGDTNGDNLYMVTVKASDGDSSATQRFKIRVTNANDHVPVITSHNGDAVVNIQVAENTITVDTVSAADGDNTAVTYSIVNAEDGSLFAVNSTTGELRFITAPDYEHPLDVNADNKYIVSVKASDGGLSAVQQFVITITDLNDNPPVATMTIQIPENTVEVTPLEGTDDDAGSTVVFTMVNKEDGALFWINPASGVLEFITAPDFEHPADMDGDNTYLVSVKMTAGDIITILRFKVKVTNMSGGAARTAGRSVSEPEMKRAVVAQTETEPVWGIKAYPNPVPGKRFTLRMDSVAAGRYVLEIYAAAGQLVYRQQLDHTGKSVIYPIQLPASLAAGMYILKLKGVNTRFTQKVLIE